MGSTSEFDVTCHAIEFNPDRNLSLPGILTNHFDKIYASEVPVVVDEEQEPNISAIDLEKEVFDLDPYSYNLTLVTSNVNTNFSNITTSSCEDQTTKLETIRRKLVGNVHDLVKLLLMVFMN